MDKLVTYHFFYFNEYSSDIKKIYTHCCMAEERASLL